MRIIASREFLVGLGQLGFETGAVHETGHRVERLLDDIRHFAHDVRHETPVDLVERLAVSVAELGENPFDLAVRTEQGTRQHLVMSLPAAVAGAFDGGNLEDEGRLPPPKLRQNLFG